MLHRIIAACVVIAASVTPALSSPADVGAPLPFKGSEEGTHVSRTPLEEPLTFFDVFEFTGVATQLGQFDLVIETSVDFRSRPVTGAGTSTFTAANGDKVVAHGTGSSALLPSGVVLITENSVIDPDRSTGRFAGATGAYTTKRTVDPVTGVGGVTAGTFEGTITLAVPAQD